jgi:hypothetical protein
LRRPPLVGDGKSIVAKPGPLSACAEAGTIALTFDVILNARLK